MEIAERVERLCGEYGRDGQLAGLLEEAGEEALLDEAVALAGSAAYTPGRMAELLDAIEQAVAGQGVHGLTRPNRQWSPLPGVRPHEEELTVLLCPVERCARSELAPAVCALTGRQLAAVPLVP